MEFLVPLHAPDLELPKGDRYHVQTVHAFDDAPADAVLRRVRELEDLVLGSDMGLELLREDCLDLTYSLVKCVARAALWRMAGARLANEPTDQLMI